MSRRIPYFKKATPSLDLQQDVIILDIHITVDGKGLMKFTANGNPAPTGVQLMTALTDSMKSCMDMINKQASMIIDPNKGKPVNGEELNAGKEAENHNNS